MKIFERAKTRRLKMLQITPERLLNFLNLDESSEYICFQSLDLPNGCVARGVHFDYNKDCFAIIVEHDSFEEVPDFCSIPVIDPPPEKMVKLQKARQECARILTAGERRFFN